MGEIYHLVCDNCNYEWDHYEGVGDRLEPYPFELLYKDETCDAQMDVKHLKCPKCGSVENTMGGGFLNEAYLRRTYLQGRTHVLAGRMQCTAEAVAVHCRSGCSELQERLQ